MKALRRSFPPLSVLVPGFFLIFLVLDYDREAVGRDFNEADTQTEPPEERSEQNLIFERPVGHDYSKKILTLSTTPLFSETRSVLSAEPEEAFTEPENLVVASAYVEMAPTQSEPQPEFPDVRFRGFVRSGDQVQALLSSQNSPEEQWVSVGDRYFDWEVVEISETLIRFSSNGVEYSVDVER